MALSKSQKTAALEELSGLIQRSSIIVLAKYSGLSVLDLQQLRRQASEQGVTIKVAKNRLLKIALAQSAIQYDPEKLTLKDQLLFAFGTNDEATPARLMREFAFKHPALEMKGALLADGQVLLQEQVQALALLPTLDTLYARLTATLSYPVRGLAGVLAANLRGLLSVLDAAARR